jgi:hypothetical protein
MDWEKVVATLTKVKTAWYTLGATGFVAVIDVVRIAVQLMQSEIKRMNFFNFRKHCLS